MKMHRLPELIIPPTTASGDRRRQLFADDLALTQRLNGRRNSRHKWRRCVPMLGRIAEIVRAADIDERHVAVLEFRGKNWRYESALSDAHIRRERGG